MKPMSDKIIVSKVVDTGDMKSKGGIILNKATETDKTPAKGLVIEVADNINGLKVDDTVIFGKYVGIPVELDEGTIVHILDKSEVLMIL